MLNKEVTSKIAASAASKVLRSKSTSKASKTAAGIALSQTKAPRKITSSRVGTAASEILRNSSTSKKSKTASGYALTQRPNSRKK